MRIAFWAALYFVVALGAAVLLGRRLRSISQDYPEVPMGYKYGKNRRRVIIRECLLCGNKFTLSPSDLEERDFDHRFCSDECEYKDRKIDEAIKRAEEREDR